MTRRSIASRLALLAVFAAALVSTLGLSAPAASGSSTRSNAVTDVVVNIYTQLGYQNSAAAGTGIVISSSGLVLTNNHVIRGATTLRATNVGNGRTYTATVLGYSVADDVALLQLKNASGLPAAKIGGTVHVGTTVTAYGNGHGAGGVPSPESGTVRAVSRSITASDGQGGSERLTGLIESDVDLEPGDSGGPLIAQGRVVGMNTAASGGYQFNGYGATSNHAFTIPIAHALAIANQIREGKASTKVHVGPTAMLGVSVQPRDFGSSGALVAAVVPGSPAERAGISAGHLITALGAKTIASPDDLARELLRFAPNDSVRITWLDQLGNQSRATARLITGPPQ
jgi:S1-C subfamily serine protease